MNNGVNQFVFIGFENIFTENGTNIMGSRKNHANKQAIAMGKRVMINFILFFQRGKLIKNINNPININEYEKVIMWVVHSINQDMDAARINFGFLVK